MKCPCKDCITLSMCKNLELDIERLIKARKKCSLLTDYLAIKNHGRAPFNKIRSEITEKKWKNRLSIVSKYLFEREW